jgi:hypothetical protein
VETTYERLPKRERPASRFWMMAFRSRCSDHDGVLRFMPKRFAGEFALVELALVMEATFELGRTELMEKLAKRLPLAIHEALIPFEGAARRREELSSFPSALTSWRLRVEQSAR